MAERDMETAKGYRDRAEELRRFADSFHHEGSRQDLLAVAEMWARMADRLDQNVTLSVVPGAVHWLERNARK